jgi:hypothetical protein
MGLECILWLVLTVCGIMMTMLALRMRTFARAAGTTHPTPLPTQLRLEFAATPGHVRKLLKQWKEKGRTSLRRQIVLDFLFILAYLFAGVASALLAGQVLADHSPALAEVSALVAWMWVLAALLDVAENATLLLVIGEEDRTWLQPVGTLFATFKWLLVVGAVAYVILAVRFGVPHVLSRLGTLLAPLWAAITLCLC